MDIVFMGTPDFSVTSLKYLYKNEQINIKAVVTQPDRPRGRGQKLKPSPVKAAALSYNLKVLQSDNVNKDQFIKKLNSLSPDAIVVVAFGQKLGDDILNMTKYGCINLHASLLPEYRGAGPIHQVIIDGRKKTGVTTMYMDQGWDTGDIIYKKEVKIEYEDTVGKLHDKLAEVGADLLVETLVDIEKGNAPRLKQDEEEATYAYKIKKDKGKIDWSKGKEEIYNLVRGVNPWPGAYTYYNGKLLKIWSLSVVDENHLKNITEKAGSFTENVDLKKPGKIITANENDGLIVKTGDGAVKIEKLQLSGKKRMTFKDFIHGYNMNKGEKLGQ